MFRFTPVILIFLERALYYEKSIYTFVMHIAITLRMLMR